MDMEEVGPLSNPLEGWPHEEQYWPTTLGRRAFADPLFMDGLGPIPAKQTRSTTDITTRALTIVGAERVPQEQFWAISESGESAQYCLVAILNFGLCHNARFVLIATNSAWELVWDPRRVGSWLRTH